MIVRHIGACTRAFSTILVLAISLQAHADSSRPNRPGLLQRCVQRLMGTVAWQPNYELQKEAALEMRNFARSFGANQVPLRKDIGERALSEIAPQLGPTAWAQSSSGAYDIAHRLIPFRKFSRLLAMVDWAGHAHHPGDKRFKGVANALWGELRNHRSSELALIRITHFAYSTVYKLDLLVGPIKPDQKIPSGVWLLNSGAVTGTFEISGQRFWYLENMDLNRDNSPAIELFFSELQELNFGQLSR